MSESSDEEAAKLDQTVVGMTTWDTMMEQFRRIIQEEMKGTKDTVDVHTKEIEELKIENTNLKSKIQQLEEHKEESLRKNEIFDKFTRKNNLIFKGFEKDSLEKNDIWMLCKSILKINECLEIVRILRIGRGDKKNFLVEFETQSSVVTILQNTSKLAGTKYGIQRDMTQKEREHHNFLLRIRNEIRKIDKSKPIKFKDKSLEIEGIILTVIAKELQSEGKRAAVVLGELYKKDFSNIDFHLESNKDESSSV